MLKVHVPRIIGVPCGSLIAHSKLKLAANLHSYSASIAMSQKKPYVSQSRVAVMLNGIGIACVVPNGGSKLKLVSRCSKFVVACPKAIEMNSTSPSTSARRHEGEEAREVSLPLWESYSDSASSSSEKTDASLHSTSSSGKAEMSPMSPG